MKYLLLSPNGLGLFMIPSLGKRTEVEKIYFCVMKQNQKLLGKNMDLLPSWEKMEVVFDPWPIIKNNKPGELTIISDDVTIGPMCDHLREMGYTVIGGSSLTDKLEDDRTYATDVFSRVMAVPETTTFESFSDGIGWAKAQEKSTRLVFKPHDGMVPKDMTYVAKDIPDLVTAMETFKQDWHWEESFQLQKFVDGVLVDFGGWFNGKDWLKDSHYLYFEEKPFLSGGFGPATGGEHAVVIYRPNEGIFFDILKKLTPMLIKSGYRGQISVNSMVGKDDKKPYFLELTPRFGYPSFPQDITALEENDKYLHDLFSALRDQKDVSLFKLNKPVVVLSVSTPPYPHKKEAPEIQGLPVSWDKKWDIYFYPYEMMYNPKKKQKELIGEDGLVANITCTDSTIDGAVAMLYEQYLPTLKVKNMQCRDDLGKQEKERIKQLREMDII